MRLLPAVRIPDGTIVTGTPSDSHATIIEAHGLPTGMPDATHGFQPNGGSMWLSRKMALGWVKRHEPAVHSKLTDVPPEGLHSGIYAAAKGIKQKDPQAVDLSDKTCLVYGRKGLYIFLAQKLGQKFKKVWFYLAESAPYPSSRFKDIGTGLPEIERVYSFWPYVAKADLIFFPDCYDGDLQVYLRAQGHRVFGSGRSEKMELDKDYFLKTLVDCGLPVAYTHRIKGLDPLAEYLRGKNSKWLKTPYYREDFETMKYPGDMTAFEAKLNDVKQRIGEHASRTIEILVQNVLKKKAEGGYDGFCVNGEYTKNCLVGYEIKDRGLLGKIFAETPEAIDKVNQAVSGVYKKLGYNGHLSTEIIFTEDGKGYFIDATQRAPSPPSEAMCEHIVNYAEVAWLCAGGVLPVLKWDNPYIAEVILRSPWHESHELVVDYPKEHADNIKLKNHLQHGGKMHCIPAGNGSFFGAVTASGKTWKEAADKAMKIAETVKTEDMEHDMTIFDEAEKQIEAGEKFGINFGKAEI
jgi:hypothetical protein